MMRHGPGPTKRSRGTVAKASMTAREPTLAVKRNSSAYHRRAVFTEIAISSSNNETPTTVELRRYGGNRGVSADCVRALNDLHQQPISAHPRTPQTEKWAKVIRFAGSEIRGHRHSERNSN